MIKELQEKIARLLCGFDIHLFKWKDMDNTQQIFLKARAAQILKLLGDLYVEQEVDLPLDDTEFVQLKDLPEYKNLIKEEK